MASDGEATPQQRWTALRGQTAELFDALLTENATLRKQSSTLVEELEVYKSAQRLVSKERDELLDSVRDAKARAAMAHQASLVSVLIDGDGAIFRPNLLAKGRDGGREAAMMLRQSVETFAKRFIVGVEPGPILVSVFVNVVDLGNVLENTGSVPNVAVWNDFVVGFNQSHGLMSMINVGRAKEAADAKMRESLRLYASMPSCGLVLFGGTHDSGYASVKTEGLLSKVVLLNSYDEVPVDIRTLNIPSHKIEGLFMPEKLVAYGKGSYLRRPPRPASPQKPASAKVSPKPADAAVFSGPSSVESAASGPLRDIANGLRNTHLEPPAPKAGPSKPATKPTPPTTGPALASGTNGPGPRTYVSGPAGSPARAPTANGPGSRPLRPVDPSRPLHKQLPPVCNAQVLSPHGCQREKCIYGHHYALTPAQRTQLAIDAKKSPCPLANQGKPCPDHAAGACHLGHVCPRGPGCRYLKQKMCRFVAPGMHGPQPGAGSPQKGPVKTSTAPNVRPSSDDDTDTSDASDDSDESDEIVITRASYLASS